MLKFDIKMRKIYVHSPFNIDKELDEFGEHFNFEWEGLPILNTLSRRKTHDLYKIKNYFRIYCIEYM